MAVQHPYSFQLIEAKKITFNKLYQRELDNRLLKRIMDNFDYHEVNPAKVVYRNGEYFAFDGQHTVTALQKKFGSNYLVPCLVYEDVPTWVEEAIMFEKINAKKERRPVSTSALWKSRNNRGEEKVVTIRKIVEKNNFALQTSEKTGKRICQIRALESLDYIFDEYNENVLDISLFVMQSAWHGNPKSVKAKMLKGVAFFINMFGANINYKRLISQLAEVDPDDIIKDASALVKNGIRTKNDIAFKMAQLYNGTGNREIGKDKRIDTGLLLK